jgi:hypothetical protein
MQTSDQLIKLSKVPAFVEKLTGDRPHIATIHRWRQRGCKGVKLQTAFAGGHCRTTEKWVREFFAEVTAAANGDAPTTAPADASQSAGHDRAERELAAAGI